MNHSDLHTKFSVVDDTKMLQFLIASIYVEFSGADESAKKLAFKWAQTAPPLLADLFLYGYNSSQKHIRYSLLANSTSPAWLSKAGTKNRAQKFNFTTCTYMIICLNNSKISKFIDLIYPYDLEIQDT